jgi:hypothetical protein
VARKAVVVVDALHFFCAKQGKKDHPYSTPQLPTIQLSLTTSARKRDIEEFTKKKSFVSIGFLWLENVTRYNHKERETKERKNNLSLQILFGGSNKNHDSCNCYGKFDTLRLI